MAFDVMPPALRPRPRGRAVGFAGFISTDVNSTSRGKAMTPEHRDGDPDKTKEEYDQDNHADQENPNNDEYDKDDKD
jgi:hypothetical protein